MNAGDALGQWRLITRLGRGGNGEVWEVVNNASPEEIAALKILRRDRRGRERLSRFRDEIRFLETTHDPGVLPLIDSSIPEDGPEELFYVMPIAEPIRRALGNDPSPETVVEAIAAVAETLARLATVGIGHRDIKPDNLFAKDGAWLIGDFGLVTYPDKDPVTEAGRRLGPIDYMAPEMRESADSAHAERADVYSLAKTVWVLVTDSSVPLPGAHRLDDPVYLCAERVTYDRGPELDVLLERATRLDPERRPTMAEFAHELRACLLPPQEYEAGDRGVLADRIRSLLARPRSEVESKRSLEQRFKKALEEIHVPIVVFYKELLAVVGDDWGRPQTYPGNVLKALLPRQGDFREDGFGTTAVSPDNKVSVQFEAAIRLLPDEQLEVAAWVQVHKVSPFLDSSNSVTSWQYTNSFPLGSAQQRVAFEEIGLGLAGHLDDVLNEVERFLSDG